MEEIDHKKNAFLFIFLLAFLLFFSNIWGYDLWAPDEPRFAEIAREMIEEGNWILPHDNGYIYIDKPPLFFWLVSIFSLLFGGVSSFTARIPSALAGIGTVYLTYIISLRSFGRKTALLSSVILMTSYLFFDKARTAQTDMLLTFLIVLSFLLFYLSQGEEIRRKRYLLLFYLSIALATLTKGPVGFIIPLGVIAIYLASIREMGKLKGLVLWEGIVLFLGLVGGWIVAATLVGNGEYSIIEVLNRNALKRFSEGLHHYRPFYYFFKTLPVDFFPWTLFLPSAFAFSFAKLRSVERREVAFVLCWFFFVLVFFSFSREKRNLYLLPLFPAASILVAHLLQAVWSRQEEELPRRFSSMISYFLSGIVFISGFFLPIMTWMEARDYFPSFLVLGFVIIASSMVIFTITFKQGWFHGLSMSYFPIFLTLGVSLPILSLIKNRDFLIPTLLMGSVLIIGSLFLLIEILKKRPFQMILILVLTVSCFYLTAIFFAYPVLNEYKSAKEFSLYVSSQVKPYLKKGERLPIYKRHRSSLTFYSGLYLSVIPGKDELESLLMQEQRKFCLISEEDLKDILADLKGPLHRIHSKKIGHRSMVLISNKP